MNSSCKVESWTVRQIAEALKTGKDGEKQIIIPRFQRGARWKPEQEKKLIESLSMGYPIGTMLLFEDGGSSKQQYVLVDGLQRAGTMCKYMDNPTLYIDTTDFSEDLCSRLLQIVQADEHDNYDYIKNLLAEFIKEEKRFDGQYCAPAVKIIEHFCEDSIRKNEYLDVLALQSQLQSTIAEFFEESKQKHLSIESSNVPIIIYRGPSESLQEIFNRINSSGTALNVYEVYAATWPQDQLQEVDCEEIVEYVKMKYDAFKKRGLWVVPSTELSLGSHCKLTCFEFLFGLSKYLVNRYSCLAFNVNKADDDINPIGFELVNACLNDSKKISELFKSLDGIDFNQFQRALIEAIEYVEGLIKPIGEFKGNKSKRKSNSTTLIHAKYQIIGLIAAVFKKMYQKGNYEECAPEWREIAEQYKHKIYLYYIYDIIANTWNEGGTKKIYDNFRYDQEISYNSWESKLNGYFEDSLKKATKKRQNKLSNEAVIILYVIYIARFTVKDQYTASSTFDIEHIVPFERLPIDFVNPDCIGNLCYLPSDLNRSKKDKTIYEIALSNIKEIEEKYTFTRQKDLEWLNGLSKEDKMLPISYNQYCRERFQRIKKYFYHELGIEYTVQEGHKPLIVRDDSTKAYGVQSDEGQETQADNVTTGVRSKRSKKTQKNEKCDITDLVGKCVDKLVKAHGDELKLVKRNIYLSLDRLSVYHVQTGKDNSVGKYWFTIAIDEKSKKIVAFNKFSDIKKKYVVLCSKEAAFVLCIPVEWIEKNIDLFSKSAPQNGVVRCHIKFYVSNFNILRANKDRETISLNQFRV